MKLFVVYNNDLALLDSQYDVFLLTQKGFNSHYQYETTNIGETINLIHEKGKLAYGWINRFIFEPEMEKTIEKAKSLIDLGLDGFVVNDFGLLLKLKEIGFDKPIILSTDTTITNHLEIDFLIEQGFSQVVTARELTYDELLELGKTVGQKMVVPIFGHQIISTSRRQLLTAYSDLIDRVYESNHVYHLKESTREDRFLLIQDETGTHIFDEKVFSGVDKVSSLLDLGVDHYWIDSFNLRTELLSDVAYYLKQIASGLMSDRDAMQELLDKYPDLNPTTALWFMKTTDKKE